MAIYLDEEFVRAAQREPFKVIYGDKREIMLRATTATRLFGGLPSRADLEIVENGKIVGYITPYSNSEHGAVRASFYEMGLPRVFRTLDEALREVL